MGRLHSTEGNYYLRLGGCIFTKGQIDYMHTSLTIKRKVVLLLSNHAFFFQNGKIKYENKTLYNLVLHGSAFEFEHNYQANWLWNSLMHLIKLQFQSICNCNNFMQYALIATFATTILYFLPRQTYYGCLCLSFLQA